MSVLALALTFFLVSNPIGGCPLILSLVKDFEFEKQKKIIFREGMFALLMVIFFQYFGDFFLSILDIDVYALMITGGVLLLMVALQMLFHVQKVADTKEVVEEPFIVPIATPLISGPGLFTIVMINARTENNNLKITSAILVAWCGIMAVLMLAPYLKKLIGKRGLATLEQVMGMVLGLMAIQMLINGSRLFVQTLF